MEIAAIDHLEGQVDQVLHSLEQTRFENLSLKQKIHSILADKTLLEQKNKHAVQEIRQLINQLKEYINE